MQTEITPFIENYLEDLCKKQGETYTQKDKVYLQNILIKYFKNHNYKLIDLPFLNDEVLIKLMEYVMANFRSRDHQLECMRTIKNFLVYSREEGYNNQPWIEKLDDMILSVTA